MQPPIATDIETSPTPAPRMVVGDMSSFATKSPFMFATASAALPQIKAGKVRALAVTSSARLPALPDVPTVVEAGLTGFDVRDWVGYVVPKGTPPEVRDRLSRAFSTAFADPAIQRQLEENTIVASIASLSPSQFQEFLAGDIAKWEKVIKEAGIEAQ